MSNPRPQPPITFVDSVPLLVLLLEKLPDLPTSPPSLYLDLEGAHLGRSGTIAVLSIYLRPSKKVYLIHVHTLGSATFTVQHNGVCLKSILESTVIPKIFFDVRNDSDALFSLFNISLSCVEDIQLMQLATRHYPKDFVNGLQRCIEKDIWMQSDIQAEWRETKIRSRQLFAPELGGTFSVFNERPLDPEIERYCAGDVVFLPDLWDLYNSRLRNGGFWRHMVDIQTKARVADSKSQGYDGISSSKRNGWAVSLIREERRSWNRVTHGDTFDPGYDSELENSELYPHDGEALPEDENIPNAKDL